MVDNYYRYDHNGNRLEKKQLTGITRYTYDTLNRLTKVEYLTYTEELFYDKAGNLLEDNNARYTYDVWGNPTVCEETIENRFKFTGQQQDSIIL